MDKSKIEESIMQRLEKSENPDDIILDLCDRLHLNWPEAEALVERVRSENEQQIVLNQSPVLVLIALVIFLAGAVMLVFTVYDIASTYSFYQENYVGENSLGFTTNFVRYLLDNARGIVTLSVFGTAMVAGSLRGMQDVWVAIFARLGIF
jgi:hypothetical protein